MTLTPDSQVILLLCSRLGFSTENEFTPYTLSEWNKLAKKLYDAGWRPGNLLDASTQELQNKLCLIDEENNRIVKLLRRSGSLAIEQERLASIGIRVLTRADPDYPQKYRLRLKDSAPCLLYYSGEVALLGQQGVAVVGSRHLDEAGKECAELIGNACGLSGMVLYSGGARGVDTISMNTALSSRGTAVGVLADNLERNLKDSENRSAITRGDLCLVTPYSPDAPFSVGNAMGRNKLIYALADYAIVVASDAEKGGTWAGAIEALKAKWIPVFVLNHPEMPEGNKKLLQKGAIRFPHPFTEDRVKLKEWLDTHKKDIGTESYQPRLL
mgnify:CR=1 FL=1